MIHRFQTAVFLFLFVLLGACRSKEKDFQNPLPPQEEAKTFGRMSEQASRILSAAVSEVQEGKGRTDWKIVVLQPDETLKGPSDRKKLKLLDLKPFPKQPSLFSTGEKVLVFLKPLPSYTAYQELIREGVGFELLGKAHGVVKGEDQKEVAGFVKEVLKGPGEIKDYYLKVLQHSPSKTLRVDLSQEIFRFSLSLEGVADAPKLWRRSEGRGEGVDLQILSKLVADPNFPKEGKIHLVRGIALLAPQNTESILKSFFCLSPAEVCLLAAQTLESRGVHFTAEQYGQALENAPADLKTGLFSILGRHHREDALPLFKKVLAQEKDEKISASIMESLGDLGGEQALELVMQYGKDRRYYVRAAVLKALGTLKSEKGIPLLEAGLKTSDPTLVMVAAQSLQKIGTPKARETLSKYYEKEHHGYWEPTGPQHFMPK